MPMAKFEPTAEQREDVAIMSAGRFSQEEMAGSIINPRTGKPITVKTLRRVFTKELCDTEFKKEIVLAFRDKVRGGDWRAIQYGMEHVVGFANGTATATATPGSGAEKEGITVRFITSPHANDPRPEPLDITPEPPWPQNLRQLSPPAEPPTISSDDENAVAPLYREVKEEHRPMTNKEWREQLPPEMAPRPLPEPLPVQGPYRTELDDPAVRESLLPLHRRKITTLDPGVVQRRLDRYRNGR